MPERTLAIARPLSWTPDHSFRERAQDFAGAVDLFSPKGVLSELPIDVMRVLSAFGRGRSEAQVRDDLGIDDAAGFAALVDSLVQRGFLADAKEPSTEKAGIPPAFLVTAHHCGGTLLRFMFDAHPNLACAPPHRLNVPLREMMDHAAQMDAFPAMGVSRDEATTALGRSVSNLLGLHARLRQKDAWVWASRDHDLTLSFVDALFAQKGRFVVLVRHPLDAADASAARAGREGWHARRLIDLLQAHDSPHLAYAHYWADVFRRVRAFRAAAPDRVHVVRYEDLVKAPDAELGKALAFIGVPAPPGLSKAAFERPHEMLEGGWESFAFLEQKSVSAQFVDLWKKWPRELLEAVGPICEAEMKAWGYSV